MAEKKSPKAEVTVATIDLREVADLRRLVDLLAAVQVCWPTARVFCNDDTMRVTVRRELSGVLAA